MINQPHHKCIIVYALHWPEAYAIAGLYHQISPESHIVTYFTPEALADALSVHKTASLILGIQPHESVFLLFRLAPYLHQRRMLFFGQKFNYADRAIPFYFTSGDIAFHEWKDKKSKQIQTALLDFIVHKADIRTMEKNKCILPAKTLNADELISYVNYYLYQTFPHNKVGEQPRRILFMLSWGWSTTRVANILGIHIKTVSSHKLSGLSRLGMGISSVDVYRGISVKAILQRYTWLDTNRKTSMGEWRVNRQNTRNYHGSTDSFATK